MSKSTYPPSGLVTVKVSSPSFINKLPSEDCLNCAPTVSVLIGVVSAELIEKITSVPSSSGASKMSSNFLGSSYQLLDDQSILLVDFKTFTVSQ